MVTARKADGLRRRWCKSSRPAGAGAHGKNYRLSPAKILDLRAPIVGKKDGQPGRCPLGAGTPPRRKQIAPAAGRVRQSQKRKAQEPTGCPNTPAQIHRGFSRLRTRPRKFTGDFRVSEHAPANLLGELCNNAPEHRALKYCGNMFI